MTESKRDDLGRHAAVMGSGNFLADQGYAEPDETEGQVPARQRDRAPDRAPWPAPVAVCDMTGLKQPDVSKIVNGNVAGFSVWRLLQVLKGLGQKVTISVETPATKHRRLSR